MKNYLKHFSAILILSLIIISVKAQDTAKVVYPLDKVSFGLGLGLEYGLIGMNVTVYPQKNVGLFGGFGYDLIGMGYNVGTKIRFVSDNSAKKFIPYVTLMYGLTQAVVVRDLDQYNKEFHSTSLGVGFDWRPKLRKNVEWSVSLLIPFNNTEIQDYMDELHKNHNVEFDNEVLPFRFSLGYRFLFD